MSALTVRIARVALALTALANLGTTYTASWSGALPINAAQSKFERELPIASDADRAHLGIVAFVQDARSGEVAQALQLPRAACLAQ